MHSKTFIIAKERHIIPTDDGSNSIFIPELKESYHSKFGSITESQHIYIKNGLEQLREVKKPIKVFEMGLGTGLNALLAHIFSEKNKQQIHYTSIEKYPLSLNEAGGLNYSKLLGREDLIGIYRKIHSSVWSEEVELSNNFTFCRIKADIRTYHIEKNIDLVFYDAFAPDVQPNLWTEEIFDKFYKAMNQNALLMTYCVKGTVRRTLKKVGFEVFKLKGPIGGKREILKAVK